MRATYLACFAALVLCAGCRTRPLDLSGIGPFDFATADDLGAGDMTFIDLAGPRDMGRPRDMARRDAGSMCMLVDEPATPNAVPCGAGDCTVNPGRCCLQQNGTGALCTMNACPANRITFACDGPEDCPGNSVCCLRQLGNQVSFTCQNNCSGLVLCHDDGDCPMSQRCAVQPPLPDQLGVCRSDC
jgi:hypothetical protein